MPKLNTLLVYSEEKQRVNQDIFTRVLFDQTRAVIVGTVETLRWLGEFYFVCLNEVCFMTIRKVKLLFHNSCFWMGQVWPTCPFVLV